MAFYETLGLKKDANETMIKKAYRELSFKNHPDRNPSPDASVKMQAINEAYETLSDPQKREQYDHGGQDANPFSHMGHPMGHMGIPVNIFEMMRNMGHMGPMGEPMMFHFEHVNNIGPLESTIELTFEQAYSGHTLPVTVTREVINGMTRGREIETMYIPIPPGMDNGEIIEVTEKGHHIQQKRGSLKLHVVVKPHEVFERKGMNLYCTHTLSFKESVCGFDFMLNLLDGTSLKLKSSPGHVIQNMDERVIKGKGIHRGSDGDLYVRFKVTSPGVLTDEQVKSFSNLL
jgi:DnaJ-class molecular chaperone